MPINSTNISERHLNIKSKLWKIFIARSTWRNGEIKPFMSEKEIKNAKTMLRDPQISKTAVTKHSRVKWVMLNKSLNKSLNKINFYTYSCIFYIHDFVAQTYLWKLFQQNNFWIKNSASKIYRITNWSTYNNVLISRGNHIHLVWFIHAIVCSVNQ